MNSNCVEEINSIKEQIIEKFVPNKIILFGSQIKGTATKRSDIDICIIKNTGNKREMLTEMYCEIESSKPFDIILYTEDEWKVHASDSTSFAFQINKSGVVLYG